MNIFAGRPFKQSREDLRPDEFNLLFTTNRAEVIFIVKFFQLFIKLSFRKIQFYKVHFVSFRFVSFRFAEYSKPK